MTKTRPTVADLRAWKGTRQLTNVFVESLDEAAAAEAAGVDILTVPGTLMNGAYRAVAPTAFIIVGMGYRRGAVTAEEYLRAAFAALNDGGDAVWCIASLATIGRLAAEGVPVVGHLGLIPPKATWTGGFKAVGKTAETATMVWNAAKDLESAGAFAAEIEIVPEAVAAAISERTSLVLLSMGSGSGCSGQYLFSTDVLGTNKGHVPRHAKVYGDLATELERVQQLRVEAYAAFVDEVRRGEFPDRSRILEIAPAEFEAFISRIDDQRPASKLG